MNRPLRPFRDRCSAEILIGTARDRGIDQGGFDRWDQAGDGARHAEPGRVHRERRRVGRRDPVQQARHESRQHENVGVTQVGDSLWLATFMQYDLGYFDDETCRLEPIDNPFGPKVLPMCSE